MEGRIVVLEPLTPEHRDGLRQAAADERIWRSMLTTDVEQWIQAASTEHEAGARVQFVIDWAVRRSDRAPHLSLAPEHRRLEIGNTWMNPSTWGTGTNIEAKYLLLRHAFETLGCLRVEFKTDANNERARAALAAIPPSSRGSTGSTCSSVAANAATPPGKR